MKFLNSEDMLNYIHIAGDVYDVDEEKYLFEYNDKGAIAVYNLAKDRFEKLVKEARKTNSFISSLLGAGGSIYDIPDEAGELESNVDLCRKMWKHSFALC